MYANESINETPYELGGIKYKKADGYKLRSNTNTQMDELDL